GLAHRALLRLSTSTKAAFGPASPPGFAQLEYPPQTLLPMGPAHRVIRYEPAEFHQAWRDAPFVQRIDLVDLAGRPGHLRSVSRPSTWNPRPFTGELTHRACASEYPEHLPYAQAGDKDFRK